MTAHDRPHRLLRSVFDAEVLHRRSTAPGLPVPRFGSEAWGRIDGITRTHILSVADDALTRAWPTTTLHDWLGFTRSGNRTGFEQPFFRRRHQLGAHVVGFGVAPSPERSRAVLDGLWLLVEEDSWCPPAHLVERDGSDRVLPDPADPVVDLFAAETGALVATTLWLMRDELETVPGLVERLTDEVRARVLLPFLRTARERFWFRQPANWNPWIMSNLTACALVCARSAEERSSVLSLVVESLDGYLDAVPQDGGCPEGIMYWWASAGRLFEALELLVGDDRVSARTVFSDPLIRALARYPLVTDLGPDWAASFGDGVPRIARATGLTAAKELHPLGLLHRFAVATDDAELAAFARARRGDGPVVEFPVPLLRGVRTLLDPVWSSAPAVPAPPAAAHWLPEIQVFSAGGGPLRLVAKGGRNDEPHNHNDIGSFVLAVAGDPVVVDAGSGRYTRDSFRERRYDAWFTTSPHHSTPLPAGFAQEAGTAHAELVDVSTRRSWHLDLELARAYPDAAGVETWRRRWSLASDGEIVLEDEWSLRTETAETAIHLLLARPPRLLEDGRAVLVSVSARAVSAEWTGGLDASTVRVDIDDDLLRGVWGDSLTLLRLVPRSSARTGATRIAFRPVIDDQDQF